MCDTESWFFYFFFFFIGGHFNTYPCSRFPFQQLSISGFFCFLHCVLSFCSGKHWRNSKEFGCKILRADSLAVKIVYVQSYAFNQKLCFQFLSNNFPLMRWQEMACNTIYEHKMMVLHFHGGVVRTRSRTWAEVGILTLDLAVLLPGGRNQI